MESLKLKQSLLQIANGIKSTTSLEDVYKQLSLLADIETSEQQVKKGQVYAHAQVISKSKKWLK